MPTFLRLALLLATSAVPLCASAQSATAKPAGGIYSCMDDRNRRLTSDRPIPECSGREQVLHNRDGSVKAVVPPTLTPDERAQQDARERQIAEQRAAQAEAARRDRNLMSRYPSEEAHNRAREAALDTVRASMRATETRLRELAAERKPLHDEAEFYKGKALPPKLKAAIDANDAAADAQRQAVSTQEAEMARINGLYDVELDRLRRLWAGVQPGAKPQALATPTR